MHHPTKFHVIPSSSLGGVRRHTDRQTHTQTHFEKYVLDGQQIIMVLGTSYGQS